MLSIVDYPGFEGVEAPDMETYSKALNAGQFPLSVLALRQETAETMIELLVNAIDKPRAVRAVAQIALHPLDLRTSRGERPVVLRADGHAHLRAHVQHAAGFGLVFAAGTWITTFLVRVALMQENGLSSGGRELELGLERAQLVVARGVDELDDQADAVPGATHAPFHVPKEWIMLERTVLLLLGLCTELDPAHNPMQVIRPFVGGAIGCSVSSPMKPLKPLFLTVKKTIRTVEVSPHNEPDWMAAPSPPPATSCWPRPRLASRTRPGTPSPW